MFRADGILIPHHRKARFVSGYMRTLYILLALFLIFCSCEQKSKNDATLINSEKDKYLDTLLNGKAILDTYDSAMLLYYKEVVGSDTLNDGSITRYGIDDSMRYFYLQNGNKLHLLNKSSKYQSPWSLGTLERDFSTFFLTRIDNGNSCPSSYQVFDKTSGLNILGDKIKAISYAYLQDTLFMLYDNSTRDKQLDSITLINVLTKRREVYKLPPNLPHDIEIQIDTLTKTYFKVSLSSYVGENFEMTEKYSR